MSKCNTSASFPLSAEAAIFAQNGQKIGKSRHKFLRNFNFLRFCAKILGSRIKMRLPLFCLQSFYPCTCSSIYFKRFECTGFVDTPVFTYARIFVHTSPYVGSAASKGSFPAQSSLYTS